MQKPAREGFTARASLFQPAGGGRGKVSTGRGPETRGAGGAVQVPGLQAPRPADPFLLDGRSGGEASEIRSFRDSAAPLRINRAVWFRGRLLKDAKGA